MENVNVLFSRFYTRVYVNVSEGACGDFSCIDIDYTGGEDLYASGADRSITLYAVYS